MRVFWFAAANWLLHAAFAFESIDTCLQADRRLDIVVSHFHEDPAQVAVHIQQLQATTIAAGQACVHIYTKANATHGFDALTPHVYAVHRHPNRGREGASILHYITEFYHNLPQHIIFVQGGFENMPLALAQLDYASNRTSFMPVGATWVTCSCDNCGYIEGQFIRLREIFVKVTRSFCHDGFHASLRGQFIVSKHAVRRHRPDLYWSLLRAATVRPGHHLHRDSKYVESTKEKTFFALAESEGGHDSPFLHALERSWSLIFGCYDGTGARQCDCFTESGGVQQSDHCTNLHEPCQCIEKLAVSNRRGATL